ncbi:AAA family ATPase [Listeria sp. ILCC797]|uniref:AAA family ATPase n=1 Tax=Listeria sp. ILCC797 TaxID=1918333 RepID=UPI000B588B07|nr:SMC family ATPase [Listeria sp. ILCC797]
MKPLKLTMEAFGAYKKLETIDFTELGTERIFVISGKTGAGKSTIFDAISFAIFGVTNLADREGASMRSDFAADSDLTEVTLTFMLREKTYFIKRMPQQEVKKARGDGMRSLNQKAELFEIMDDGEKLLASSVRDVKVKMEELIQLNVDQFRQILMIPQGEFRELLISESKEKEVILQRLAHTDFYKYVENLLFEKQKELQLLAENTRTELWKVIVAEFADETLTIAEIEEQFQTKMAEQKKHMASLQDELTTLEKVSIAAAQSVAVAENIEADFVQLEKQLEELELLYGEREKMQELKRELTKMKAAKELQAAFMQRERTNEKIRTVQLEKEQLENQTEDARTELLKWEEGQRELLEMANRVAKWRRNQIEFEKMAPKMRQLTENLTQLEFKKAAFITKEEAFKRFEVDFEILAHDVSSLEDRIAALENLEQERFQLLENMNELEGERKQVAENVEKTSQLLQIEEQLAVLRQEQKAQTTVVKALQKEEAELLAASKQEQAALLATHLHNGDPCPVCGATEHPQMATFSGTLDIGKLEELSKELETKTLGLKQVEEKIARLKWQTEQWGDVSGNDFAVFDEQLAKLTATIETAKQKQAKLNEQLELRNKLKAQLNEQQAAKQNLTHQMTEAQIEKDKLQRELDLLETEINWLYTDIPENLREPEAFKRLQNQIAASLLEFEKREQEVSKGVTAQKELVSNMETRLKGTEKQLAELSNEWQADQTLFEEKRVNLGFQDEATFKSYLARENEIPTTETTLSSYEKALFVAEDRKQVLAEKLKNVEKKDVSKLQAELDAAKAVQSEAEQKMLVVRERGSETSSRYTLFNSKKEELLKFEAEYADLGLLADTARGKNDLRITFERYVLATFLDTIVQHANVRLLKMTNGRFELSRKRDKAKGNAQSGLELEVYDEYTGLTRHVKTLSGGESFKTSLALALALAEVVQEMAGGISLDTMFIDEGFGTLDPESLETAIECLLETQENGRLVGIISHVPELKERIPARLEVTATNQGSKTEFVLHT